jgi:hypothetical protein
MGIIVGIIVPPRLEAPDTGGQLLDIDGAFRIRGIKGDGLLSQSLNCQEMFDTTIKTSFFVMRKVVFQKDALFADLPQIELGVHNRQKFVVILFH